MIMSTLGTSAILKTVFTVLDTGVPASAGLASSPGVGGSRSAEERDALQRSGLGAHATTGESERIIGLRVFISRDTLHACS